MWGIVAVLALMLAACSSWQPSPPPSPGLNFDELQTAANEDYAFVGLKYGLSEKVTAEILSDYDRRASDYQVEGKTEKKADIVKSLAKSQGIPVQQIVSLIVDRGVLEGQGCECNCEK